MSLFDQGCELAKFVCPNSRPGLCANRKTDVWRGLFGTGAIGRIFHGCAAAKRVTRREMPNGEADAEAGYEQEHLAELAETGFRPRCVDGPEITPHTNVNKCHSRI